MHQETNENGFKNCLPLNKTNTIEWLIVWKIVIKLHQTHIEGRQPEEFGKADQDDDSDEDRNETMSNIETIPELTAYCDYFERFVNDFKVTDTAEEKYQKLNFNHCVIVLLEIAQMNDFGDEIGRNRLQGLLRKILIEYDVSDYVIKEISQVIELLISNSNERLTFYNGIVNQMVNLETFEYSRKAIIDELIASSDSDVRLEANRIKHQMMTLKEQETKFVEVKQYAKAQIVSEEYLKKNEELIELLKPYAQSRNDTSLESLSSMAVSKKVTPAEIVKNLRICYYSVVSKGVKSLMPENVKIYNSFVRYHLESKDIVTRIWALKAATAYCLLYETFAKDVYMILKSQFLSSNNPVVWRTAISCIVDVLLRYTLEKMDKVDQQDDAGSQDGSVSNQSRMKRGGRSLYTDDGEESEDMNIVVDVDIVQVLTHVFENNVDAKVQKTTVVGLCKLIVHGQLYSRDLVSRFLIMYFNPATEAETNQVLGVFFESLVKMKKQESLHDALFPTLVTLLEAPCDSPLREVKMQTVIKYVIGATRPVFCSIGLNLHNTLALKLIEVMKSNPENKEVLRVFTREMLTLEISEDPLLKKDIVAQIENLLKLISVDVRTKKNITDFRDILNGTYRPSLQFSSTATASIDPENEDAGVLEDCEDGDKSNELENVSKLGAIEEVTETEETTADPKISGISEPPTDPEISDISETPTGNMERNEPSEELPVTEEPENISLPATQEEATNDSEDEASEISSDDEINETVIEGTVVSDDVESLPPTPDEPKTPKTRKSAAFKRQLELTTSSRNSPMRKNPRNTTTPRISLPSPKTPASTRRQEVPITPKTPKLTTAQDTSTPKSGRMTRKQAREEIAQSSTLTRSASRKIKIDPKDVIEKATSKADPKAASKSEPKPAKVVKKSVIPVPTKTSLIRASRVADTKKSEPKPSSSTTAAAETKPVEGRPRRVPAQGMNLAGTKTVPAARRPRWN